MGIFFTKYESTNSILWIGIKYILVSGIHIMAHIKLINLFFTAVYDYKFIFYLL